MYRPQSAIHFAIVELLFELLLLADAFVLGFKVDKVDIFPQFLLALSGSESFAVICGSFLAEEGERGHAMYVTVEREGVRSWCVVVDEVRSSKGSSGERCC